MQVKILAFGIARDIVGGSEATVEIDETSTVAQLRERLYSEYPEFAKLASLAIARNNEYAEEDELVHQADEIVLIPPVSGG